MKPQQNIKPTPLEIDKLSTPRLILIPYTIEICQSILRSDYTHLEALNLKKGISWPD